jgi:hypothetical protein
MLKYTIFATVAFVIVSSSALGATATEYATDDTFVSEYYPGENFGTEQILLLGIDGAIKDRITFIRFDLTPYYGLNVHEAYLRLYITKLEYYVPPSLCYITGNSQYWNEKYLTWANKPGGANPADSFDPPKTTGWWTVDVTSAVRGFVKGTYENYGFRLSNYDAAGCVLITLCSKEGGDGPELVIDYSTSVKSTPLGEIKAAFK